MSSVAYDFTADGAGPAPALGAHWACPMVGGGRLEQTATGLRLALEAVTGRHYSNAQLDDYSGKRVSRYPWRPPLRLRVRARASHGAQPAASVAASVAASEAEPSAQRWLRGTWGFGFWNAPFTLAGGGLRLPEAVWFFGASPPSNMALTREGVGFGWKAQVVHARRWRAAGALAPLALAALWARVGGDARAAAGWMERLTGAHETAIERTLGPAPADLRQWHDYALEWLPDRASFTVDGQQALVVEDPPTGPLGFVAWIDNQYAIATPRGELRFGALTCDPQWLELASLSIEPLGR